MQANYNLILYKPVFSQTGFRKGGCQGVPTDENAQLRKSFIGCYKSVRAN